MVVRGRMNTKYLKEVLERCKDPLIKDLCNEIVKDIQRLEKEATYLYQIKRALLESKLLKQTGELLKVVAATFILGFTVAIVLAGGVSMLIYSANLATTASKESSYK
jgi:hypothetical protein